MWKCWPEICDQLFCNFCLFEVVLFYLMFFCDMCFCRTVVCIAVFIVLCLIITIVVNFYAVFIRILVASSHGGKRMDLLFIVVVAERLTQLCQLSILWCNQTSPYNVPSVCGCAFVKTIHLCNFQYIHWVFSVDGDATELKMKGFLFKTEVLYAKY